MQTPHLCVISSSTHPISVRFLLYVEAQGFWRKMEDIRDQDPVLKGKIVKLGRQDRHLANIKIMIGDSMQLRA